MTTHRALASLVDLGREKKEQIFQRREEKIGLETRFNFLIFGFIDLITILEW